MIFEVIASSFFSGLGSAVFRELINQASKKDEAKLRRLIRQELEAIAPSDFITVNDTLVNELVQRLKGGEILAYPVFPGWPTDAATYQIVSVVSGKVLDVSEGCTEDGAPIIHYRSHEGANQHWRLLPVGRNGDGVKILCELSRAGELSEKVLAVSEGRLEDGAPLIHYHDHGGRISNGDCFGFSN